MINHTTAFRNACFASSREIRTKVLVNLIDISNYLVSGKITEYLNGENFGIGDSCSKMCELDFNNLPFAMLSGNEITIKQGIKVNGTYQYIDMGTYLIADKSQKRTEIHIVGYDKMAYLTEQYEPSAQLADNTIESIVSDICYINGITLKSGQTFPSIELTWQLEGCTTRELLGLIASLMGANVRINREDELEFTQYTFHSEEVISESEIFMGELDTDTSSDYVVNCLECSNDTTTFVSGSGRKISFYNPYVETQSDLDAIVSRMSLPFSYRTAEVKYRGNPCFEVGDIVTLMGNRTPIMKQEWEIGNKLCATLSSFGLSDNGLVIQKNSSNTRELIKKSETKMAQAFAQATQKILGIDGGYYELLVDSTTGKPYGFRIMNTPTVTPTTKGWQGDYNGIGYSTDGFNTISKVALDMANGTVVADTLVADAVIASHATFNDLDINGGTIEIQSNQSEFMKLINAAGNAYSHYGAQHVTLSSTNSQTGVKKSNRLDANKLQMVHMDANENLFYDVKFDPDNGRYDFTFDENTFPSGGVYVNNVKIGGGLNIPFVANTDIPIGTWDNKTLYLRIMTRTGSVTAGGTIIGYLGAVDDLLMCTYTVTPSSLTGWYASGNVKDGGSWYNQSIYVNKANGAVTIWYQDGWGSASNRQRIFIIYTKA